MPSARMPTGKKPGRPSLESQLLEQLSKSKSAAAKALRAKLRAKPEQILPMVTLAKGAVKDIAAQMGQDTMYQALTPALDVVGETAEEQTDSAVSQMLRRMHYLLPQAVATALKDDPQAFVKTYLELIQYKLPKLAKQELVGTMNHTGIFVPVEQRDVSPAITVEKQADGSYAAP